MVGRGGAEVSSTSIHGKVLKQITKQIQHCKIRRLTGTWIYREQIMLSHFHFLLRGADKMGEEVDICFDFADVLNVSKHSHKPARKKKWSR